MFHPSAAGATGKVVEENECLKRMIIHPCGFCRDNRPHGSDYLSHVVVGRLCIHDDPVMNPILIEIRFLEFTNLDWRIYQAVIIRSEELLTAVFQSGCDMPVSRNIGEA